jgi:sporulation protein YqfC
MCRGETVEGLRAFVARFFELPEDLLLDLPRLTLVGDVQLLVENHRGIRAFRPERVVIVTARGPLVVEGDELVIGAVDPESVVVTGRIARIAYGGGR